jgi:hypothetical protein
MLDPDGAKMLDPDGAKMLPQPCLTHKSYFYHPALKTGTEKY